jgi:CxxC-x17-CxxC domain-containing protein
VINVELPESPELLTHRIGRTGRMGRQGQAITLLGPEDLVKWRRLERGFTRPIPRAPWRGAAALANGAPASGGNGRVPEAALPALKPSSARSSGRRASTATEERAAASPRPRRELVPRRESSPRPERTTRGDAQEPSGRELLRRYGRDPRRPSWADAAHGHEAASATTSERSGEPGARQRHESVCSGCGRTAQTSFRPDPARPVYCDRCYRARKGAGRAVAVAAD